MVQIRSAEILNKVALHLHKKGINQWDYPWDYNKIEQDIKNGHVYVMAADDLIIGTFLLKNIDDFAALLIDKGSKYQYRVAIVPEHQGANFGTQIINYVFEYSKNLKKPLYLDCWAGNKKLKSFYRNAGFEHLGNFPEEDYFISVFKYNKIRSEKHVF